MIMQKKSYNNWWIVRLLIYVWVHNFQKQIALSAGFEYQVQIVQIVQQTSHGDYGHLFFSRYLMTAKN